ncbi:MAG: hypothetical protein IPP15_11460 [Saprospiraceae bacterium]|uniref:FlgD/Vpr Ig-like domain-containing protein n=1 Tax=Candidatus Opimibacter skivensis TaxID=2982028 RepID=A0A9D7XQH2_9BACT|nr:hypothetical protein [Candidatus Opimibacter skivensis]
MKLQLSKKLFAFIIAIMMFSVLPGIANAQQSCQNGHCPSGYFCLHGHCVHLPCTCRRPIPFRCGQACGWYADPTHSNDVVSISDDSSADFSLTLTDAQYVSLKIYDITGRLIKTLAKSRLPQGENEIEWDQTDDYGKTVSAGIYILQLDAGPDYSDTIKLSVMN